MWRNLEQALRAFPEAKEALEEILERSAFLSPEKTAEHIGEAFGRFLAKLGKGRDAKKEAMIVLLYGAIMADIAETRRSVEVAKA